MTCDIQEYDSCNGHEDYRFTAYLDIGGEREKVEIVVCERHSKMWRAESEINWKVEEL